MLFREKFERVIDSFFNHSIKGIYIYLHRLVNAITRVKHLSLLVDI